MSWLFGLLLKPFIAVAFFVVVFVLARLAHALIPDGKVKDTLFTPLSGSKRRGRHTRPD